MFSCNLKRVPTLVSLIALTACGGGGGDDQPAAPPPPPSNSAPQATIASSASSGYSSQSIDLDGSGSSDSDGTISSYAWTQTAGPTVSLSSSDGATTSFSIPPLSVEASITIELQVTDDDGDSNSTSINIDAGAAPLMASATVANNAAFKVDDEMVDLSVSGVTLDGTAVPATLRWTSDIQGTLGVADIGTSLNTTLQSGTHTLTLEMDGGDLGIASAEYSLPVLPRIVEPTPFQASPATNHKALVPIILISHIPTTDGINLDTSVADYFFRPPGWPGDTVQGALDYANGIAERKKFAMEERTKFRGYKDPGAEPYLGYQILAHYVFYEAVPLSGRLSPFPPNFEIADHQRIMSRINAQDWVNNQGVREIWVMNYFNENDTFEFWESNMSTPDVTLGDISNSDRVTTDLPIFNSTYVVYGINYFRTQAEAIHNTGHQIEAMLLAMDFRADGNSAGRFWGDFVGANIRSGGAPTSFNLGACGWTHMPPNTTVDYDYENNTLWETDCEDWRPDRSGSKITVNNEYFRALDYDWPMNFGPSTLPQDAESNFYIWWMQSMPGENNGIPYQSTTMSNWWEFIADWDAAIATDKRLYE